MYSEADDLQWNIDYWLSHDDDRETMAEAACDAVQDCTFLDRAREIVVPAMEHYL